MYGIAFIQGACNFYELESNTEQKAKEYDEKLDEVLFLQNNSKLSYACFLTLIIFFKYTKSFIVLTGVGFVGLLATCLVGLIVAFLIPLGTFYVSLSRISLKYKSLKQYYIVILYFLFHFSREAGKACVLQCLCYCQCALPT